MSLENVYTAVIWLVESHFSVQQHFYGFSASYFFPPEVAFLDYGFGEERKKSHLSVQLHNIGRLI